MRKVLDQRATIVWKEFVAGALRFPGLRIKPLEARRKKEMTRRLREMTKFDARHREQVVERHAARDSLRESIGAELRVLRQDKYGWILHAESRWVDHIQQLVHERGIWPMVAAPVDGDPDWQLCATEGPYRMRKKLERRKINQEDIGRTRIQVRCTLFTWSGLKILVDTEGFRVEAGVMGACCL